ncbi:MAG TPA: adenylate/guanylate cyclase domain-containing protein [Rhodanobacteraceae bacterium]|nr:adenylate/guanylate cyclase domain-containing protein [Rhodanobacteraceae bacterium]
MSQRQSITILFADVSGSTKLFELRGDEEARRIISNVLRALVGVTENHGGRLIKTIGDEIMCTFPGPLQGLFAATDMQRLVKSDPVFVSDNLAIRVGLHHGDALVETNDVFGDAVNVSARMAQLARRDQIVATASTAFGITNAGGLAVRALGTARVAGKLRPIEIVDILWQDDLGNVTLVQRAAKGEAGHSRMRVLLRYQSQAFEIDEVAPPFTLGRDPGSSLSVEAEWISRNHAMIEWKSGHFVLTDRSTNGTWVRIGEEDEFVIHRDEFRLRKSGSISLGQASAPESTQLLFFECDYG